MNIFFFRVSRMYKENGTRYTAARRCVHSMSYRSDGSISLSHSSVEFLLRIIAGREEFLLHIIADRKEFLLHIIADREEFLLHIIADREE